MSEQTPNQAWGGGQPGQGAGGPWPGQPDASNTGQAAQQGGWGQPPAADAQQASSAWGGQQAQPAAAQQGGWGAPQEPAQQAQQPQQGWGGAAPDAGWGGAQGGQQAQPGQQTQPSAAQQGGWQNPGAAQEQWQGGWQKQQQSGRGPSVITSQAWLTAVIAGFAAYLVAAVAAGAIAGMQAASGLKSSVGNILISIPSMVAGGFGNAVVSQAKLGGDTTFTSASVSFSVLIMAAAILTAWFLCKRLGRSNPVPKGLPRVMLSAVAGLVFGALSLVLGLTVHYSYESHSIAAGSFLGTLIAVVSVGLAAYLGLSPRGDALLPSIWRKAGSQFLEHVLVFGGLLSIIRFVVVGFSLSGDAAKAWWLNFLQAIPNGIPEVFSTMHFGAFGASGDGVSKYATIFEKGVLTDVGGSNAWIWASAMVLFLVGVVVTGLRWRLRAGVNDSVASYIPLPAMYLVGGLALMILSITAIVTAASGGSFDRASGGVIMVAGWSFVFIFLLGAIIELFARFAADPLLRALPANFVSALAYKTGANLQEVGARVHAPRQPRGPKPAQQGGWNPQQAQAGGWAGTQQGGDGYGAPAQDQGGWSAPQTPEQPAQQGGWAAPQAPEQPAQQGGWGAPQAPEQPAQQGGWGAPQAPATPQAPQAPQAPQQGGWGAPTTPSAPQAPDQSGGWGAPQAPQAPATPQAPQAPQQGGWNGAPQQGQPQPPQNAWGAPAQPENPQQTTWGAPQPTEPGSNDHGEQPPSQNGWGQQGQ